MKKTIVLVFLLSVCSLSCWAISQRPEDKEPTLNHEGGDIGVNTIVEWRPQSKDAVIIFTNGDNGWKLFGDLIGATLE